MTTTELRTQVRLGQEMIRRQSQRRFSTFVKGMKADYDMQWFHRHICEKLDEFEEGGIKKLMILLPPQHGKSELASRLYPSYSLGRNPNKRIGMVTYNDTFAKKFNRQIQRYIDTDKYYRIFPNTRLNNSKITGIRRDNFARTNNVFEVVDKEGSVVTVGRDGQMTGLPIDLLVLDDLYKNREEAISQQVNEKIWTDYNDVFLTRLHNRSQQLIMNTRWDEFDLSGRLLAGEFDQWQVIKFPAIRTEDIADYDPRKVGEALWPGRHSLERLLHVQKTNETTFNSLYQQDPKPNTALLIYPEVIEIDAWPSDIDKKFWGLDFGFTSDPSALIKGAVHYDSSFFEELLYEPGVPMRHIATLLRESGYRDGELVYCDHVPANIAELRRLGIAAVPAIKGDGSINAGIVKMKEFKIHVTRRSVNMLQERRRYQWVTVGTLITNEPIDKYNHCWDGARYGLHGHFFHGR